MNLTRLDLNTLLVFDAVLRERSATRAARRLHMSQPAVSNALSKLRHAFDDDLFVRSSDGLRPTPRALELEAPVGRALLELEQALDPVKFDPESAKWTFRIVANDYFVSVFLPRISERLCQEAPLINVQMLPDVGTTLELLDNQRADFAFGLFHPLPERFSGQPLMSETKVVVMSATHPLAGQTMSLEDYAGARHLAVAPTGDTYSPLDDMLLDRGLTRRVVMVVNQFSVAAPILRRSDMIATLPSRVAMYRCADAQLVQKPLPLDVPSHLGNLIWHGRLATHPAHQWFRNLVREVAEEM